MKSNEDEGASDNSTMIEDYTTDEILDLIQFESLEEEPEEEEIYDCTLMDGQNIEHIAGIENQEKNVDLDDTSSSLFGMTKGTIEEMYELYYKHAREVGFSVRKGTNRYSTSEPRIVLGKLYRCSSAGERVTKENSLEKTKSIAITRTKCPAMMIIKLNDGGVYEVVKHTETHNHLLTRREWNHLHRSERRITDGKAKTITEMLSSGMRATESFHYMAHVFGGEENVGHQRRIT